MPDLVRSGGWSPAVLEQWYRDHLAAARYDLSQSGLPATTLDDLLSRSGLDPSDLLQTRLDDGDTFGSGALRAAVARRWGAETSDGVMMTHGSSEAIFLVVSSLLKPG